MWRSDSLDHEPSHSSSSFSASLSGRNRSCEEEEEDRRRKGEREKKYYVYYVQRKWLLAVVCSLLVYVLLTYWVGGLIRL